MTSTLPAAFFEGAKFKPPEVEPHLEITIQPKKRGYRFRYDSEKMSHGSIPGEPKANDPQGKSYPTVRLVGHSGPARIVMTLVTVTEPYHLHPHTLIMNKEQTKGFHVFVMEQNMVELEIRGAAIQQVLKKNDKLSKVMMNRILQNRYIEECAWNSGFQKHYLQVTDVESYVEKLMGYGSELHDWQQAVARVEKENLEKEAKEKMKYIDMTACRLCFQAFLLDKSTMKFTTMLERVYSEPIYDAKTKQGCDLKIQRIDKSASTVEGNKEIWMIAKKIDPEQTQIIFSEENNTGHTVWRKEASFNKTDVVGQTVIFKTPAYHNQNITQPVTVNITLKRKKDDSESEPFQFTYKPKNRDPYGISEKRKKALSEETLSMLNDSDSATNNPYQVSGYPFQGSYLAGASSNTSFTPPFNFNVPDSSSYSGAGSSSENSYVSSISATNTFVSAIPASNPFMQTTSLPNTTTTASILQLSTQHILTDSFMQQLNSDDLNSSETNEDLKL